MSIRTPSFARRHRALWCALAVLAVSAVVRLPAQEAASKGAAGDQDAAKRLRELKDAARRYTIERESDPPLTLTLVPEPVLRWNNPVRAVYDGAIFVWLADGRPEVVASLYRNTLEDHVRREFHEFKSLSASPLTATFEGKLFWSPRTAGITMAPVPGAPKPAADAAARLRQMRALAREFTVGYAGEQRMHVSLRQLTQPLYRYETSRPDLLDGALFAFVLATDPETLLVFEARPVDGVATWHYGLARMVSRGLSAWHKERLVWEVPSTPHLPHNPYMTALAPTQP